MGKRRRSLSGCGVANRPDSMTSLFIRATWFLCFVVGAVVLYSTFVKHKRGGWGNDESFTRVFADFEKKLNFKGVHISCSSKYLRDISKYPDCKPKNCGRYVTDNIVSNEEVNILLSLLQRGLSYGGSLGGASVLDLHTGAMSKGVHFINLYKMQSPRKLFETYELKIYKNVREKIREVLASKFGIMSSKIYLTKPTFFSRLTNKPPLSSNDEYWHPHVDKDTYPSFHYTTLLYLNDYGVDFQGGQFMFLERGNSTSIVQPKKGRLLLFTSGQENMHFVERVTSGTRFAVTVSFTCNQKEAVTDPFANIV